jgi:hypothetical protein
VFEGILDVSTFSLRIAERDVPRILEILQAVPERKIRSMQAHLGHVWHRCVARGLHRGCGRGCAAASCLPAPLPLPGVPLRRAAVLVSFTRCPFIPLTVRPGTATPCCQAWRGS